jgi:hypothetical protein
VTGTRETEARKARNRIALFIQSFCFPGGTVKCGLTACLLLQKVAGGGDLTKAT